MERTAIKAPHYHGFVRRNVGVVMHVALPEDEQAYITIHNGKDS